MPVSRRQFLVGASSLAIPAVIPGCSSIKPHSAFADYVLLGGDIHTVNLKNERVEAMAVANGKVLAVGSSTEIQIFIGRQTRQINLDGRTVLPGINDSHLHLQIWALSRPPYALDLTYPTVKSIADVVNAVEKAAAQLKPGEWILGRGWDQAYFSESRAPRRQDLDAVAPNNPVALTEFSGHSVWASSKALAFAGIDRNTVAEPGGVIVKDTEGEPTGLLFEGPAFRLRRTIPEPSPQQKQAAIVSAMQAQLRRGITSATEPGLSVQDLAIFADIAAQRDVLKLRVNAMLRAGTSVEALKAALSEWRTLKTPDEAWLQLRAVKIMGDGIPTNNKTAWLNEPYETGGNGSLLLDGGTDKDRVEQLREMILVIHDAGLQAGTHATGSRSIDEAVTAYAQAQANNPRTDPRHYLIHADLVSETTLKKMAELGVGGNFNPEIKFIIADSQIESIGPTRAAYEWPYRSALDAGVVVANSSDAPVTEGNWLQGIATCMDRKGKQTGNVSGPGQRIGLDEAIRAYTIAGAWQDHADHYKGSLEAGKVADFCVVDGNLSRASTADIPAMQIAMTAIDGRIAHAEL